MPLNKETKPNQTSFSLSLTLSLSLYIYIYIYCFAPLCVLVFYSLSSVLSHPYAPFSTNDFIRCPIDFKSSYFPHHTPPHQFRFLFLLVIASLFMTLFVSLSLSLSLSSSLIILRFFFSLFLSYSDHRLPRFAAISLVTWAIMSAAKESSPIPSLTGYVNAIINQDVYHVGLSSVQEMHRFHDFGFGPSPHPPTNPLHRSSLPPPPYYLLPHLSPPSHRSHFGRYVIS